MDPNVCLHCVFLNSWDEGKDGGRRAGGMGMCHECKRLFCCLPCVATTCDEYIGKDDEGMMMFICRMCLLD